MPGRAFDNGGGRLIPVAANASCQGLPTRASHLNFAPAPRVLFRFTSALLRYTDNASVPHAKGVGADQSFASSSAARAKYRVRMPEDVVIPSWLAALKRSNGWKNMRNSSLSFA